MLLLGFGKAPFIKKQATGAEHPKGVARIFGRGALSGAELRLGLSGLSPRKVLRIVC